MTQKMAPPKKNSSGATAKVAPKESTAMDSVLAVVRMILSVIGSILHRIVSYHSRQRPFTVAGLADTAELHEKIPRKDMPIKEPDWDKSEIGIWTPKRGYKLFTRTFKAQAIPPKEEASGSTSKGNKGNKNAIVFYHHGIGGCVSEAYKNVSGHVLGPWSLCHDLSLDGFDVYGYDAVAHGYSGGYIAEEEGCKHYLPSPTDVIDDFEDYIDHILNIKGKDTPFFLFGESWGGQVSLLTGLRLQEKKKNFLGIIFQAPAIHAYIPPAPVVWVFTHLLAPLFPTWISRLMPINIKSEYGKLIPIIEILSDHVSTVIVNDGNRDNSTQTTSNSPEYSLLTDDPVVEMNITDPKHCYNANGCPFRMRTAATLLEQNIQVRENLRNVKFPFLCVQSSGDRVCFPSGGVALVNESQTDAKDKKLVTIENCNVHMFTFSTKSYWKMIANMGPWLDQRLTMHLAAAGN
ncbi:unnamed protein product [Amoebophrya sp. A25]|nr:unnamed protein product [Amoebophrya sp. A25]|eukprot:GSA25T00024266001.1